MDFEMLNSGLKLVEEASGILESISNEPGVTPKQFYKALDLKGIFEKARREVLLEAAASVELALSLISEDNDPTIH